VKFVKIGVAAALCCATLAQAESFLEVVNGSERRSAFFVSNGVTEPLGFVIGRLRYDVDLAPGEVAFLTFTVLGDQSLPALPSFTVPGATLSADGRSYSLRVTGNSLADFSFSRADGTRVSNSNNASWQDMNFGIALDANRLGGQLLLEDALLGNDFDYNDLTVRFQMRVAPIPEPSTYALAAAGLGVLVLVQRRRRRESPGQNGAGATPAFG
jgi:PEP-CTERM motif